MTSKKKVNLPRCSDHTTKFKKDWNSLEQSGRYHLSRLKEVMLLLIANNEPLPATYLDHALQGEYSDCRECHIGGDWLLIYRLDGDTIVFVRTGTHSQLF
jgi:mRNA interferase YafQ